MSYIFGKILRIKYESALQTERSGRSEDNPQNTLWLQRMKRPWTKIESIIRWREHTGNIPVSGFPNRVQATYNG
ncbi:hypothetical protein DMB44_04885 [Thermoplasma sp. Kam2015]|nr:hypothetical protein DMB44_04885 [Thermoplasma sp. Kam2015]